MDQVLTEGREVMSNEVQKCLQSILMTHDTEFGDAGKHPACRRNLPEVKDALTM